MKLNRLAGTPAIATCGRPTLAAALLLAATGTSWAQAPDWSEPERWYATATIGRAVTVEDPATRLDLGGSPVAIKVNGITEFDSGSTGSISFGRQGRTEPENPDQKPRFWRVEAEWWTARLERKRFEAGMLKADLDDRVRARGLFLNGVVRVAATENTRWWLGGGVGRIKVSFPGASAATSACRCLEPASSTQPAWRLKFIGERPINDSAAWYLELAYTDLWGKSRTVDGVKPQTEYDHPGVGSLGLGLRVRF